MLAADAAEPLVLADGRKIDPTTGKVIKEQKPKFVEIPTPSEAQAIVVRARKSVADLPAPPAEMNVVALVGMYTMFGLNDVDIAIATDGRLTVDQIKNIRLLDAYTELMKQAKENILNTQTDTVRDLFQSHAKAAAEKIIDIATDDESDGVLAFKASQDILDRAGHRPADIVEHRHAMQGGLQIEIIRKDQSQRAPVIDVIATEIAGGIDD